VDEVPHTSCGCFQNLAFRIHGHDGLGIMKRGSAAVTPDGRTGEMLAMSNPLLALIEMGRITSPKQLKSA
jgi:CO dehydrogenase/acetyl-CoA synthase beta subunit